MREPGANRAGERVIGNRRHQDAGNDGPGLAQPRGEDEGQELSLVPDLGDGNQQGGGEESFQATRREGAMRDG